MRALLSVGLLSLLIAAACSGGGEPRVPEGPPLTVVRDAPAITRSAGRFEVFLEAPGESASAEVDLGAGSGPAEVRARLEALLGLLEDARRATPFGGQQVRGAASFRYEVETAEGADIDVWIDASGRLRRIEVPNVPLPPDETPAPTQPGNGLPSLLTVDLVFP